VLSYVMLATKVTSRVFAVMRVCSVGHVEIGPLVDVGVYPYVERPEASKTDPNEEASSSSEFTKSMVTTSLVLASIHVLISANHASNDPASNSVQVVWQSSRVPFEL